jgi:hypothetical protein
MKRVLQRARSGEITVAAVPAPQLLPVRIAAWVVSAGASARFVQKSLLMSRSPSEAALRRMRPQFTLQFKEYPV